MMTSRTLAFRTRTPLRTLTICKVKNTQDKSVFQFHPNGLQVSFDDMRDAHELLSDFPQECREDMYASLFNIDSNAMDKYYRHALTFEKMYNIVVDQERKKKSFHFKLGSIHVYICKD